MLELCYFLDGVLHTVHLSKETVNLLLFASDYYGARHGFSFDTLLGYAIDSGAEHLALSCPCGWEVTGRA